MRQVTVVDPRRRKMAPGYQYTERDYVSVPVIETHGTWSVAELVNFRVDSKADPRNIEMVMIASNKAQERISRG